MAVTTRNQQSQFNPRTPVLEGDTNLFTEAQQRFWIGIVTQVINLVNGPTSLSGTLANRPVATGQAENTRYFATNTLVDYINIYGTPGDPTTAAWVVVP